MEEAERDQATKIFQYLDSLYGDKTPAPVLRSQFFSCKQQAGENVSSFILRLRELCCGLRRHDPDTAPSDAVLRDQLLLGLREGPLAQALRVYAQRNPGDDFAALRQEALLLDEEHGGMQTEVTCHAVNPTHVSRQTQEADWKEALRKEIMDDVKAQMQGLTTELLKEIKPLLQPAMAHTPPPPTARPERRYTAPHRNERDEQGRPICRQCKRAGHIARFCRATTASQPALN